MVCTKIAYTDPRSAKTALHAILRYYPPAGAHGRRTSTAGAIGSEPGGAIFHHAGAASWGGVHAASAWFSTPASQVLASSKQVKYLVGQAGECRAM